METINQNFDTINQILDSTIEGIMLIKEGFIININDSFLKILDYENKDEIIGNLATGCLMPYNKEKYLEYNKSTFQEISLVSKNGIIIPAIIKINHIIYKNEKIMMVSILDLTELKEKENLLIKQSRMAAMGEVLSMIAHQWRQPLNSIASAITNIKIKIAKKNNISEIEEKIDNINNYLQYMSFTINDFKNFFKNDKVKSFENITNIVNSSYQLLESSFNIEKIKFDIEKKELSNIYINKNELIQIILNILNNAREVLIENKIQNPSIHISFEECEKEQVVYIKDNGGGISDEIKDRIFEPYFSTKKELNGTGLGLYMCKLILENNNYGKIFMENENDGACFKIVLNK